MTTSHTNRKPKSRTASKREMLRWYHHRYTEKLIELAKPSGCSCHPECIEKEAFKLLKDWAAEVRRFS